jgi:Flp pilus assembly secretin CpaC
MTVSSGHARTRLVLATAFCASLLSSPLFTTPTRAETVTVTLDQAKLLKLPDRVATVVIGNPLIVDATLQPGGSMVLTGKGYGATNLMALDRAGEVLLERNIKVQAPRDSVVVYRGVERQTYSCAPKCERQIMLGDSEAGFNLTLGQTVARNAQAQGAAR